MAVLRASAPSCHRSDGQQAVSRVTFSTPRRLSGSPEAPTHPAGPRPEFPNQAFPRGSTVSTRIFPIAPAPAPLGPSLPGGAGHLLLKQRAPPCAGAASIFSARVGPSPLPDARHGAGRNGVRGLRFRSHGSRRGKSEGGNTRIRSGGLAIVHPRTGALGPCGSVGHPLSRGGDGSPSDGVCPRRIRINVPIFIFKNPQRGLPTRRRSEGSVPASQPPATLAPVRPTE